MPSGLSGSSTCRHPFVRPDGGFKAGGLSQDYRQAAEGHSLMTGHPTRSRFRIENVAEASLPEALRLAVQGEGIGALCFIPLSYQGRLLGKFMVYYDSPHSFTEGEIQLAQTIANQLAFGLERKKADEALREARDRLADQAAGLEHLVHDRTVQLTETNKQLQAFVYSIAHDLRAPLRHINGLVQLLPKKNAPHLDSASQRYLKTIAASACSLASCESGTTVMP
jgi:GAF domain-containing protein